MIFIAHRGNIDGCYSSSKENSPEWCQTAFDRGFEVEMDIWMADKKLWSGHEYPCHEVSENFLDEYKSKLWLHCKDVDTFRICLEMEDMNCFMHDKDLVALTGDKYLWTYNNASLTPYSIAVMPEHSCNNWSWWDLKKCSGICTDYPELYKKLLGYEYENTNRYNQ